MALMRGECGEVCVHVGERNRQNYVGAVCECVRTNHVCLLPE